MRVLVTGGAGFIGSWVVKRLLGGGEEVYVIDNLTSGKVENLKELRADNNLKDVQIGDICDSKTIGALFGNKFDVCIHLAALINVHESIENPTETFEVDAKATFNLLEECRKTDTKFIFASTCMVYDTTTTKAIDENHPVSAFSPYAGAKLAAEHMTLSYFNTYGLPATVLRPFNTYGPLQIADEWGGAVIPRFIRMKMDREPLTIYGDGTQTRDFLYIEDCAEFFVKCALSDNIDGEILNAGYGKDISIKELAVLIAGDSGKIVHVEHPHPQSEIQKLLCNSDKANRLLNWTPKVSLEEGIKRTEEWIKSTL